MRAATAAALRTELDADDFAHCAVSLAHSDKDYSTLFDDWPRYDRGRAVLDRGASRSTTVIRGIRVIRQRFDAWTVRRTPSWGAVADFRGSS